jgi:hypothetical protein
MTDREMLEYAAKAAGVHPRRLERGGPSGQVWIEEAEIWVHGWDPLTDDGDALRLAVKLRISLIHEQEYMGGPVLETLEATSPRISLDGSRHVSTECLNDLNGDEFAATRRAIVRAAAEIGNATVVTE